MVRCLDYRYRYNTTTVATEKQTAPRFVTIFEIFSAPDNTRSVTPTDTLFFNGECQQFSKKIIYGVAV
jgi:hypothetical protein